METYEILVKWDEGFYPQYAEEVEYIGREDDGFLYECRVNQQAIWEFEKEIERLINDNEVDYYALV